MISSGIPREQLLVLKQHLDAENDRDMERTLATLAEDCLFEDVTLGQRFQGRSGARRYYQMWWNSFSPSVEPLEGHWTTDGLYVAEVHFRGTHTGHFLGIPPTGNQLDLPVVIIVTGFPAGLLGGERMYWDMGTLLRQLGIEELPTEQVV